MVQSNKLSKVAEVQLVYKSKVKASERPKITKSADAFTLLKEHWNDDTLDFIEKFKVMLLTRSNRVLGIVEVSSGGVSETVVDPKIIFASALKAVASGIILAHNHPSGNLKPSSQDLALTKRLKQAGEILGISVLDHLIITSEGYYSFAEDGMM